MVLPRILHLFLHFISILYQSNAFSMKIFPIDSHYLKILPTNLTSKERHNFLVNISLSRSLHVQGRPTKLGPNSITSPLTKFQGSYFVTKILIGNTPEPIEPYVVLDTFSNLTWIQGDTCGNQCFDTKFRYPFETSPTYTRLSLDDQMCVPKKAFDGSCGFEASIGSGHTEGYLGLDTFIFVSSDILPEFYPKIIFGCAVNSKDIVFNHPGQDFNLIAGVLGLSPGPLSFLQTLDRTIKGRMSLCIPQNGTTTISFGDDAKISGDETRKVQTIGFLPNSRYHLKLAAIVVDGFRLLIDPSVFALDSQEYKTGFFLDPGSPVTVLVNVAYITVRMAVVNHFDQYGFAPYEEMLPYDLCYPNELSGFQTYPTISFNFQGDNNQEIQYDLPPENLFAKIDVKPGFCFLIAPTNGPTIFGALQLVNHRFLFDITNELLSFVPEQCANA